VGRVAELGSFGGIAHMGYDIHITRKEYWVEEDGPAISLEEWLAYVASDADLRLSPERKTMAVMTVAASKYPTAWLDWVRGDIYTKNPDEPILAKMLQIASVLGAKVQGDDGEFYRSANFEDTYYGEGGHP
jgi:hypothetical protein